MLDDLRAAGWPTHRRASVPDAAARVAAAAVQAALSALEPLPGARALTRVRFPLLVSASA